LSSLLLNHPVDGLVSRRYVAIPPGQDAKLLTPPMSLRLSGIRPLWAWLPARLLALDAADWPGRFPFLSHALIILSSWVLEFFRPFSDFLRVDAGEFLLLSSTRTKRQFSRVINEPNDFLSW